MKHPIDPALPIGLFDSGMGGLTVLNALKQLMPNENYIYLGDTARLPYGTKSPETVMHYALNATKELVNRQVKLMIIACNTASSVALPVLQKQCAPIPVLGVIQPSAQHALEKLPKGSIAVLATEGTVKSRAYSKTILAQDPNRIIYEWPCSLLVALAEEGWHKGTVVEDILKKMLSPLWEQLDKNQPKALLLGCTHFPVLISAIQNVSDENTLIIDSACSVAQAAQKLLQSKHLLTTSTQPGLVRYLVTDGIERFQRVGKFFFHDANTEISPELITLELNHKLQDFEALSLLSGTPPKAGEA